MLKNTLINMGIMRLTQRSIFIALGTLAIVGCFPQPPNLNEDAEVSSVDGESMVLSLPVGFAPDGITIANDGTIYVASFSDGTIVRGRTDGSEITEVIVEGVEDRPGWGMDLDSEDNYLFVAGGFTGTTRIYDANTGALTSEITLTNDGIVNDVIVTSDAAYYTNSALPEIYEVPLDNNGNVNGDTRVITLSGDFEYGEDYFANGNGIEYTDNGELIVNHSYLGKMYAIDVATGVATEIDLGGDSVSSDGIALDGLTLYGVESSVDRVAELKLSDDLSEASIERRFTAEIFDFPTLIALDDKYVYVVNGKLDTLLRGRTSYEIIRIPR